MHGSGRLLGHSVNSMCFMTIGDSEPQFLPLESSQYSKADTKRGVNASFKMVNSVTDISQVM